MLVACMIGSSFVATATTTPGDKTYAVYNWTNEVVNTVRPPIVDSVIHLNGTLTITAGGSLTLQNTTLIMYSNYTFNSTIEVQNGGTLVLTDDGDGWTPMSANDTDASVIMCNNSLFHYNFYVRDGAHFDATRSEIHNAGYVPVARDSFLKGGTHADTDFRLWQMIAADPIGDDYIDSFKMTVNSQTADLFNPVTNWWNDLNPMTEVGDAITNRLGNTGGIFSDVSVVWDGTAFNFTAPNEDPFKVSSIERLATSTRGIDISGKTARPAVVMSGNNRETSENDWWQLTNGTFRVTINGVARNVGPINFTTLPAASWIYIQNKLTEALQAAGFTGAYFVRSPYNFLYICAGTGGYASTISAVSPHSGGIGTDISGTIAGTSPGGQSWLDMAASAVTFTPGWWLDCADNATKYSYAAADMSKAGIYIRSNFVNIGQSLISENAYALIFDSCLPETFLNNNITDNTGTGFSILNKTTPGYAVNYELRDNNFNGNYRAIQVRGSTVTVNAHNLNVSENQFGMEFYGNTLLNADIRDNEVWCNEQPYNTGSSYMHGASTIYLLAGTTGTVNANVERNNILGNFRGGIWAGYVHGGLPSQNLNLLVANNTIKGNDGGEWYHASNAINVKIVDNDLGSSNVSAWGWTPGERFRIGYAADEVGSPGIYAAPVTNHIEVARNNFLYHDTDETVYVGGLFKVAGKTSVDMSFVDNKFTAIRQNDNTIDMGGIIRAGWVPTGDDTSFVSDDLSIDFSRNDFLFWNAKPDGGTTGQAINVGGMMTLHAKDTIDVICNDNVVKALSETPQYINGLIMLRADRTNSETYEPELPHGCDHVNVQALRNFFDFRQTSSSSYEIALGGMFRFAGEYTTTTEFRNNTINMAGNVKVGGLFQAGEIHNILGTSRDTTAAITGNKMTYLYSYAADYGPQDTAYLFSAWDNLDVVFEDNYEYTTYGSGGFLGINAGSNAVMSGINLCNYTTAVIRNNVFRGYIEDYDPNRGSGIGGIIQASGNKSLDITIDSNVFDISTDGASVGGVIQLGGNPNDWDPVNLPSRKLLDNLTADITDNNILININGDIGGMIKTSALDILDLNVLDNTITVIDNIDGSYFGHFIAAGWGEDNQGNYMYPKETNVRIDRNNINAYYQGNTQGNGIRVRGDEITLDMNDNNILGHTADTGGYDVLSIRVGYMCESDGILAKNATVNMANNRLEGTGRNAAVHVGATNNIDFSFIGGTAIGTKECSSYTTENSYGHGIALEAVNITAEIADAELAYNRGAGIYLYADNNADMVIDNCSIHDNGWHGIYMYADEGRVTGTMTDTDVIQNTADVYGNFPDPDEFAGIYARNATLDMIRCVFDNPASLWELQLENETHVDALDTYFNRDKAQVIDSDTLLVRWTLDVLTIHQASGRPLPGCAVTVRNVTNAIVATGTTGVDGHWTGSIVREYYRNATLWTNYTPHSFLATKAPASASKNVTVDEVMTVVLVLDFVSPPPVADAGGNLTVGQDMNLTFNGSASTDDMPPLVSYVWTFNNGTANVTLVGMVVNYTFPLVGVYNVTLTVTDIFGDIGTDTIWVTVTDSYPPTADAGLDQTVNEDTVVAFSGAGSSDSAGVTNYTWTFTDVAGAVALYDVAPTYTFIQPGIYVVTLTVSDAAGNTAIDTVTVTVLDVTDPVPNAGADQTIAEGGTAHFDASASADNVAIVAFEWTFNDGTNDVTLYGLTNNYTFPSIGSYEVTLVAFDAAGNSAADTMWVHVVDVTAPAVLVISPGNSLTEVPLNWSLVIVFTEPMNTTSVEEAFSMTGFTGAIVFTWDATGSYVHVAFTGGLAYETAYTFTLGTNATDLSGNHLAAAYTASFTTLAAPEEPPVVEPETSFFTDNWWILVVIIVVLAVLLLVSLLRGGKKEPQEPAPMAAPPAPPTEPPVEQAPEELPPEGQQ